MRVWKSTVGLLLLVLPLGVMADAVKFALPDLDGRTQSLEQYRGKWVVVNYWATWCPPCLEEIPDLVDFHDRHKDSDAVVVGVNYEDIGVDRLSAFVDSYLMSYPILRSDPFVESPLGPVPGLPTTYIIDPDGNRVARQVGPLTSEQLEAYIEAKKKERRQGKGES